MDNQMDVLQNTGRLLDVDIESEMKKSFIDYSMSVLLARALPDVRDGLKPVHRRIIYAMYEDGITPDKPYRKCATTVGDVLGRYHPHGDASVYDALVRMAQPFSMREMLVDGHGNFGSVDGDPPAAYRYTEARMSKISLEMITDIEKDTVDFMPNFDDTLKEPVVLPSRFPNLLVNGSVGIAVGMATNIPPHNLREVIDAACLVIRNPDATLDELMEHIKGPDFPTGGIIMGLSGIRAAYGTGRGKITVRARAEIIENEKNGRTQIVVTELPYQVNKAKLIEQIADMVRDKRLEGISNIEDHSDREGMRITIDIKRDASANIVLNNLYRYTKLQDSFGVINLAVVDGTPKVLTLSQMLQYYIDHQLNIVLRRTIFDRKKALERCHILEGLKIAQDNIDEVISIIRSSPNTPEAKVRLMARFDLDDAQTTAIVQMQLGRLSGLERDKIESEITELRAKIADYTEIIGSEGRRRDIVHDELKAIAARFGSDRRTSIEPIDGEVDVEDLIPEEDIVITLTKKGYVKRQKPENYATQHRGGKGITGMHTGEEDVPVEMFIGHTHDWVLFFSTSGKVSRLKGYEIPEGSRISKGTNIVNLLPLTGSEKITNMIKLEAKHPENLCLVLVTKKGIIKRTPLDAFDNCRKSGLIALTIREDDALVWADITSGSDEILVATHNGYAVRFNENDVRVMGRTAAGVRAVRLTSGDEVISMAKMNAGSRIMTISENGFGRVSPADNYRLTARGGKGIINYRPSNGKVASVRVVDEDDDAIIINDGGVIIRISVSEIRECARPSKGVRVMRLPDGVSIVAVACIKHEEGEETVRLDPQEEPDDIDDLADDTAEGQEEAEDTAADEDIPEDSTADDGDTDGSGD